MGLAFFLFALSSLFTLIDSIGRAPILLVYTGRKGVIKTADNPARAATPAQHNNLQLCPPQP